LRLSQGPVRSAAQRALAQYHQAYGDLEAVLLGANDELLDRSPAEGDWSPRKTIRHMMNTELAFWAVCRSALRGAQAGQRMAAGVGEQEILAFAFEVVGGRERFLETIETAPALRALLDYYRDLHLRILDELAAIADEELVLPSRFWESESLPLQFRLHRFDAHLRQHTIQVEKILFVLRGAPTEAQRLLRLVYGALAEAEAKLIGAPGFAAGLQNAAASLIEARIGSVANAIDRAMARP
jgi:hypothetical protein